MPKFVFRVPLRNYRDILTVPRTACLTETPQCQNRESESALVKGNRLEQQM